jgi:hypothetical protein
MRHEKGLAALLLVAGCAQAFGADGVAPRAAQDLLATYPGVRLHTDQGQPRIFYGAPMTPGLTPQHAAETWLDTHSEAFGAGRLQLAELWATPVMNGRFTAFGYHQHIDGLPVEYGNVRILVLNEPVPRVVYAAATVAAVPDLGQARMNLDGHTAQQLVQAMPLFRGLERWTEPELGIYQGDGEWKAPVVVWKFLGENPDLAAQQSKTFFVDVSTGRLVHVRNEIYHNDITGSIRAMATPGTDPDAVYNPPVLMDVPGMRVRIQGGAGVFAGLDGLFSIPSAGTLPVTVGTGVGTAAGYGGRWVDVVPNGSTAVTQTINMTPPGVANFVLNQVPAQAATAQVNVFIQTINTHNYFKSRAPNFTGLDLALRANTGVSGTCNAFFQASGPSINFYNAGGGCPNTGYSSVIAHEYGHFIVNRLNLAQGGFGEGYSDVTAMLQYDDGHVGRGWSGQNTSLRNPLAANIQYPCTAGGVHACGQILGGVWWRARQNLGAALGSEPGLARAQDLQVAWSLITVGGIGSSSNNSAHPGTVIEVLTIDDNDGNLANGTPNWSSLCPAFAAHNIPCPALTLLEFQLPQGVANFIPSNQPFAVPVNILPVASTVQPGTERLVYRINGEQFVTTNLTSIGTNQYTAVLPPMDCGRHVDFYFTVQTAQNVTLRFPEAAPETLFSAAAGVPVTNPVLETMMDVSWPAGWSATGLWHVTAACAPTGNMVSGCEQGPYAYYGRTSTCNYNLPTGQNSGTLSAPMVSLPQVPPSGNIRLSFCYALETHNLPNFGKAELLVNGQTRPAWRIADVAPTVAEPNLYWRRAEIDLTEFAGQDVVLGWRFDSATGFNNIYRGWHLNNVKVLATTGGCEPACYANCDGSTAVPILNVADFTCFINEFALASGLPVAQQIEHYANCDGSQMEPVLNVDDFTCFINQFALGCP